MNMNKYFKAGYVKKFWWGLESFVITLHYDIKDSIFPRIKHTLRANCSTIVSVNAIDQLKVVLDVLSRWRVWHDSLEMN